MSSKRASHGLRGNKRRPTPRGAVRILPSLPDTRGARRIMSSSGSRSRRRPTKCRTTHRAQLAARSSRRPCRICPVQEPRCQSLYICRRRAQARPDPCRGLAMPHLRTLWQFSHSSKIRQRSSGRVSPHILSRIPGPLLKWCGIYSVIPLGCVIPEWAADGNRPSSSSPCSSLPDSLTRPGCPPATGWRHR